MSVKQTNEIEKRVSVLGLLVFSAFAFLGEQSVMAQTFGYGPGKRPVTCTIAPLSPPPELLEICEAGETTVFGPALPQSRFPQAAMATVGVLVGVGTPESLALAAEVHRAYFDLVEALIPGFSPSALVDDYVTFMDWEGGFPGFLEKFEEYDVDLNNPTPPVQAKKAGLLKQICKMTPWIGTGAIDYYAFQGALDKCEYRLSQCFHHGTFINDHDARDQYIDACVSEHYWCAMGEFTYSVANALDPGFILVWELFGGAPLWDPDSTFEPGTFTSLPPCEGSESQIAL